MKYYLDTEFITGFKRPIQPLPTIGKFNKKEFFIELISIGILAEDGRKYYAVSNELNPSLADDWVKKNVLWPIIGESGIYNRSLQNLHGVTEYSKSAMKAVQKIKGKSTIEIRNDIVEFMGGGCGHFGPGLFVPKDTEIYAYYADYDWVVFCSIFGRMIDLPSGMPMYCKDLKQMLDERIHVLIKNGFGSWKDYKNGVRELRDHSFDECLDRVKGFDDYPKEQNAHNALDDAIWNYKLHRFIDTL